ncbi:hypothetical protein DL766_002088 [Monosporascus sp. MC13-8B]|uniref:Uncharacterized protein n=1 Tax=Monosporascus cannonballus TaxID=155416 RepID=A0ABY0GWZ3_9PEZI|nr:hypothetical protein DL762_008254 [Monosporascus cannonballus]RYO81685.1 hypothetical protein DL763_008499 [Monosporascus cannonballus]RYP36201.1 hypothetical protein DL766_002088 [Monosporascus sp. MC13-8B]
MFSPDGSSPSANRGNGSPTQDDRPVPGAASTKNSQSSANEIGPSQLFVSPTPGFDPADNEHIRRMYEKRKGKAPLQEDKPEDRIEAIIKQKIDAVKNLRDVSPEEEQRMADKIRKLESGRWLSAVRPELVGQTTVPIKYFNRLVAENERCIGYVAKHTARSDRMVQEREVKIRELEEIVKNLQSQGTTPGGNQGLHDAKYTTRHLNALNEENNILRTEMLGRDGTISELKSKLQACEARGVQCNAKIRELEAALASAKSDSNEEVGQTDNDGDIQALRARIVKLEVELRVSRETNSKNYNWVQELEEARQQWLAREQGLKNNVRRGDEEVKYLKKEVGELTRQLANARTESPNEAAGSPDSADERLSKYNERLIRDNQRLSSDNERLREEIEDLGAVVMGLSEIKHGAGDGAAKLLELSDALAVQNKRNRELIELKSILESERYKWMQRIEGKEPEWWKQVEAISKAKRDLDLKVLELFERLQFTDKNLDGLGAIARLNQALDRTMSGDKPAVLAILRLAGELQVALRGAATAQRKVADLQKQLNRSKRGNGGAAGERLPERRYHDFEEFERRVDAKTQMFRLHRRAYLDNIFGADRELRVIAAASPDADTRNGINRVCENFLSPQSFPNPPPGESRR